MAARVFSLTGDPTGTGYSRPPFHQAPTLTSSSSTIGARFWLAIPTSIPMPAISTVPPPMPSAPNVLRAGRIPRAGIFTPYNARCGAACTIASPGKMRTILSVMTAAGRLTRAISQCTRSIYLSRTSSKSSTHPASGSSTSSSTLYFYPPAGVDLDKAMVDIVRLKNLVTIGDASSPHIRNLTLAGLTFRHTLRTFMDTVVLAAQ